MRSSPDLEERRIGQVTETAARRFVVKPEPVHEHGARSIAGFEGFQTEFCVPKLRRTVCVEFARGSCDGDCDYVVPGPRPMDLPLGDGGTRRERRPAKKGPVDNCSRQASDRVRVGRELIAGNCECSSKQCMPFLSDESERFDWLRHVPVRASGHPQPQGARADWLTCVCGSEVDADARKNFLGDRPIVEKDFKSRIDSAATRDRMRGSSLFCTVCTRPAARSLGTKLSDSPFFPLARCAG